MRSLFVAMISLAGCGDDVTRSSPGLVLDAAVDGAPPDVMARPVTLFESASVRAGEFRPLPARSCDGWQPMVGVRITTTEARTITALGALVHHHCPTCGALPMVMAIVPLDPTTDLPMTSDLGDAIGSGVGEVAYVPSTTQAAAPPSTTFPASFELPAGRWGLVIGSGVLGVAPVEASLSFDVEPVGTPSYFVYSGDSSRWVPGQTTADEHNRFFLVGY